MTTIRKILNAFSVVLTVLSVLLGAYFIFTSFQKLSLYRVPIILNIISILVTSRFIFLIITVVVPIYDFLKKFIQKAVIVVSVFIIVLCAVFAYNAYSGYNSFRQSSNTSFFENKQTVGSEIMNYLPFYDYFYRDAEDDTFYAVTSESTNRCSQINITNKSGDSEASPSYSVYYFNSKNKALLLKFVLEEYFYDFKSNSFERLPKDDDIKTESGVRVKFYENEGGYSAVINSFRYICYFKLSNIDKNEISLEEFSEVAARQADMIDELSGYDSVPGAQHIYSVKDN